MKKLAILGSGGREMALAMALKNHISIVWTGSTAVTNLFPGFECAKPEDLLLRKDDLEGVIIGPDQMIKEGWGDRFRDKGIPVLGATSEMGKLEWSKSHAKKALEGLPQGRYKIIEKLEDLDVKNFKPPYVIKQDGLASGKGVLVSADINQLKEFVRTSLNERPNEVLVQEEFLEGEELSLTALVLGKDFTILPTVRDHKQRYKGNQGPMTGGMGIVAPHPRWDQDAFVPFMQKIVERIFPYEGVLFVGLMITQDGPKILEINCRWGDPETIGILLLMKNPWEVIKSYFDKTLKKIGPVAELKSPAPWVVSTAVVHPSYPKGSGNFETVGTPELLDFQGEKICVPASLTSASRSGAWHFSGGRLFHCVGIGDTLELARERSLDVVFQMGAEPAMFREDIGGEAVRFTKENPIRRFIIFASGRGSNAQSAWTELRRHGIPASKISVFCNHSGAQVLARAKQAGITTHVFETANTDWIARISQNLRAGDFLLLLGFDRILPKDFFEKVPKELLFQDEEGRELLRGWNIHPSLLPDLPGLHAYRRAHEEKRTRHGCTVHWVTPEVDAGPIVAQESYPVDSYWTFEQLEKHGIQVENQLIAKLMETLAEDFEA